MISQKMRNYVLSKLGDDISTDDIIQAKYMNSTETEDLAKICLRDHVLDFHLKMASGGFLVAGKNFGCGSSREMAPVALKAAGAQAVLAEGFARIFYRNALNICLPVIECPGVVSAIDLGDELDIDLSSGSIRNMTKGTTLQGVPIPGFLLEMMKAGGLVAFLKERLAKNREGIGAQEL
jgi:3-isopropylmalate/(R)-2-methylmalate dehydratase small subunit